MAMGDGGVVWWCVQGGGGVVRSCNARCQNGFGPIKTEMKLLRLDFGRARGNGDGKWWGGVVW